MKRLILFPLGLLFAFVCCTLWGTPAAFAQDHVVAPAEIQKDVGNASSARQANETEIQNVLSSREGQEALRSAHIDAQQVKNAIPQLNDQELAQLSARTAQAERDFAAGGISHRKLIWIIAGAAALIVLIAVVA